MSVCLHECTPSQFHVITKYPTKVPKDYHTLDPSPKPQSIPHCLPRTLVAARAHQTGKGFGTTRE